MVTNDAGRRAPLFDLIGVGALNVDHIVGRSAARRLAEAGGLPRLETAFGDLGKPAASLAAMAELLAMAAPFATAWPGGSAFNVVRAVAAARRDLRLGLVGVLARRQAPFEDWLQHHPVDGRFVIPIPTDAPGLCASLTTDAGQRFKCFPGANAQFAAAVGAAFDAIVDYLSSARIVYLSPLYDDAGAVCLGDLVAALRCRPGAPLICFDPGPWWSRMPSAPVRALCRAADILLVDEGEWRSLAGILHEAEPTTLEMVVVKEPGATVVLKRTRAHWDKATYRIARLLAVDEIEDATGAGDVFAAGFLIGRWCGVSEAASVELGHRLMRAKLLGVGAARHHRFARACARIAPPSKLGRVPVARRQSGRKATPT